MWQDRGYGNGPWLWISALGALSVAGAGSVQIAPGVVPTGRLAFVEGKGPVYRLRWALSRLWQTHAPRFSGCHPYRPRSHITWPVCSLPWWTTLWHQCGFLF
jgi:hypothetical protein